MPDHLGFVLLISKKHAYPEKETKRANVAACLAHAVLSTYVMIAYAIIPPNTRYLSFIPLCISWGDERNASGDQRMSISCVKWTACARHAATLALVVFHLRNSFCWSPCHKTGHHALRHTFHTNTLDLVAQGRGASVGSPSRCDRRHGIDQASLKSIAVLCPDARSHTKNFAKAFI